MNTKPQITWKIGTAHEALAVVPYLIGFHPTNELITLEVQGKRLTRAQGRDLPQVGTPAQALRCLLEGTFRGMLQRGADAACLIGYGAATQLIPIMTIAREVAETSALDILDLIRVTNNRFYSHLCTNPECCPPEGRPYDIRHTNIAAQGTALGLAPLPDRAAVVAQVAPITGTARHNMHHATRQAKANLEKLLATQPPNAIETVITTLGSAALSQALKHPDRWPLPDDKAAWLTVLLEYAPVLDKAMTKGISQPRYLEFWADLTRRAEPEQLGNIAALCAVCAWEHGQLALGNAALNRIIREHPEHHFAQLTNKTNHINTYQSPENHQNP